MSLTIRELRSKLFEVNESFQDEKIDFINIDAESGHITVKFENSILATHLVKGFETCLDCGSIALVLGFDINNVIISRCDGCGEKRRMYNTAFWTGAGTPL